MLESNRSVIIMYCSGTMKGRLTYPRRQNMEIKKERAYKPGSVHGNSRVAAIPLHPASPSDVERPTRGFASLSRSGMGHPPLFGLAHDEVCHAVSVAGHAVGSYPAFSPLPSLAVCFLWHFLYAPGLGQRVEAKCLKPQSRSPARPGRYPASRPHEPGLSSARLLTAPRQRGSLPILKP